MFWCFPIPIQSFRLQRRQQQREQRSGATDGTPLSLLSHTHEDANAPVNAPTPGRGTGTAERGASDSGSRGVVHIPIQSRTHPDDADLYTAPNKSTSYAYSYSYAYRRRPPPPEAETEAEAGIEDEFDAATTRGANTEWSAAGAAVRRVERPRSPVPHEYAHAGVGAAAAAAKVKATVTATTGRGLSRVSRAKVYQQEQAPAQEGCVGIVHELERKFGGAGPDLTLGPGRRGKEQEAAVGGSGNTSGNAGIGRIGYPTRLGSVGRAATAAVGGGGGVHARRSLEMVDRRVLESGPERTVTISTWREQVAHEADQQANMDVYYSDARERDYGYGGEEEEMEMEMGRKRSLPQAPALGSASDPGSIIRTITDEQSGSAPVSQVQRRTTLPSTSTSTRTPSSHLRRSAGHRPSMSATELRRPLGRWQPTPPQTPPRALRGPQGNSSRGRLSAGAGRSSPAPAPRSSTPTRVYPHDSAPSFHPTQSGSTISTIKSTSTLALEGILASCDPSLMHVAPALARLGIRNDGHLRAVGRLSDETRNRELRDAAMREGITVMEWAILLDRLQGL